LSTPLRWTFPHEAGKSFFKRFHVGAALIRISLRAIHRRLHVVAAALIRISLRAARSGHWHLPLLPCSNRPSSCDRRKAKGETSSEHIECVNLDPRGSQLPSASAATASAA